MDMQQLRDQLALAQREFDLVDANDSQTDEQRRRATARLHATALTVYRNALALVRQGTDIEDGRKLMERVAVDIFNLSNDQRKGLPS